MIKSSLFDLKTWSSIYCAEAKLSDAALRRTQTLEEQPPLVNGFKGSSTGIHVFSQKFRDMLRKPEV